MKYAAPRRAVDDTSVALKSTDERFQTNYYWEIYILKNAFFGCG